MRSESYFVAISNGLRAGHSKTLNMYGTAVHKVGPTSHYLANFDLLPLLSHFVTHLGTPIFSSTIKDGQKPPIQNLSQLFAWAFVWKVLSGWNFVRSPFCQNISVTSHAYR